MPRTEVAVIGGGVIGVSVAYFARKAGHGVTLFERGQLASGSTGRAAGGMRTQFEQEINVRLSVRSQELWRGLRQELGADFGWHESGYLIVARNEAEASALERSTTLQEAYGVHVRMQSPRELAASYPGLRTGDLVLGVFTPADGHADPHLTVHGLAERAAESGVDIKLGTSVRSITPDGDGVAVATEAAGTWLADWAVVAAGIWSTSLARELGVNLPLEPRRHQLFVSAETDCVPDEFPCFLEAGQGHLFVRREGPALIMGYDSPSESARYLGSLEQLNVVDWDTLPPLAEHMCHRFVGAENIAIRTAWAGAVDATLDHVGIVGEEPRGSRIIWATGFSGHGFMHAPAVAELISDLLVDTPATEIPDALLPERFERARDTLVEEFLV